MPVLRIVTLVLCYFLFRVAFADKKPEEVKDNRINYPKSLVASQR
jgi:hypothetical protein